MIGSSYANKRRARLLYVLLALLAVLLARLFQIQVLRHEEYLRLAEKQHRLRIPLSEARGTVSDRHGRILAVSRLTRSLWVDPGLVDNGRLIRFLRPLAELLNAQPQELYEKCTAPGRRFVWLRRHIEEDLEKQLTPFIYAMPGFGFREEWLRHYTCGAMLSPVLGVVGLDQDGLAGIELYLDRQLRSVPGEKVVLRDAFSHQVSLRPVSEILPERGRDLRLTLDRSIQTMLCEELSRLMQEYRPNHASGIVMDPLSGEILALATLPAHQPGDPIAQGMKGLQPLMLAEAFEPGSTMKPFVYGAVLEAGLGRPEERLDCGNGAKRFGGRIIHDVHPCGVVSLEDVIAKSSNIGAAQLGLRLGNRSLHSLLTNLGFGQRTYLPVPGETTGTLRPLKDWSSFSTTSIPMGHEIAVNMVQMATAYAALANGGYLLQPYLVKSITLSSGQPAYDSEALCYRRIFSKKTCDQVRQALVKVVESGTATRARSQLYTIAGKTGTTEKIDGGQYSKKKNVALFSGFAPASRPRLVVMITVDEPQGASFGGVVAAPAASRVLEQALLYLGVPPEQQPEGT